MRTRTGNCYIGSATWRKRRASVDGLHDKHCTFEEPCEVETLMHGFAAEAGGAMPSSTVTGRGNSGALHLGGEVVGRWWSRPRR
jgi:hypothetical protein